MSTPSKPPKVINGHPIHLTGSGRQFKSDFLERFSYCHGLVPLFVYVPVVALMFVLAATDTALGFAEIVGMTAGGLFFWTLTEYWLHRTFFHWERFPRLYYFVHGIHHEYPNDRGRMVMPPGASAFLAVPFYFIFQLVFGYALGLPFFGGFVIGYLWYDMTHFWTHVGKARSPWGKMIRRYHMLHHFRAPNHYFGVSTPLWDVVFGTLPKKQAAGAEPLEDV